MNWFDITEVEGRLSLNSKFGDIMGTLRGKLLILSLMAQKLPKGGKKEENGGLGFNASNLSSMMDMMKGFTLLRRRA